MDYYSNINQQVHLYFFHPVQQQKGDVNMKEEYTFLRHCNFSYPRAPQQNQNELS